MTFWRRRPVSETMAKANLPTPSAIFANMLALQIAGLSASDEYIEASSRCSFDLKVADKSRVIEVSLSNERSDASIEISFSVHKLKNLKLSIGMPGAPKYRSVELSCDEAKIVVDQILALRARSRQQKRARLDAENQQNAITLLEHLL
jgi:hypothetical protein